MSLGVYLIFMTAATGIAWGAWYAIVSAVNPQSTTLLGIILFYATLTAALSGTFALIGFFARSVLVPKELMFQRVLISFRQGLFFSILIDGFLVLQHLRLLTWYNAMFLILGLTIAEFFMISRKTVRYRT